MLKNHSRCPEIASKTLAKHLSIFHVTEATGEDLQNNRNAPSRSGIGLALPE